MKTILRAIIVASSLVAVVSCGGGGGSAGTSPFDPNAGGPSASNLTILLSSSSIDNSGAQTVTATATASTGSGQVLTGIPVNFSVDNGATFTQGSTTTGANGQTTAVISIGANPSNRVITVRATSGSLSATAPFAVTGALLSATGSAIVAPGSVANQVNFRLTNSNGLGVAGQDITVVAGTLGTTTGTTDTNGSYVFTYTAPSASGSLDIVGSAGGVSKTLTVLVQSGAGSILPAVGPINSASVSANPSVVSTNVASSSTNRTEIRALFVGPSNTPIARVRVRFDLNNDPNSIGGAFSTGSSVIYSDSSGIATTAYIPGTRASPTNGVTIRACYDVVDFAPNACPNMTTTTVTVASDPLSVTIGSNNTIITGPTNLTYRRQYVVLVVDASGRAKGNVDIVPSIDLPIYLKGQYVHGAGWFPGTVDTSVTPNVLTPRNPVACLNEDVNRNGVLESSEDSLPMGNHSGAIEPRKSDATITIIGNGKTDDNGSAVVQVEYPQNVASWLQVKILVSATGVSGTEGRATWTEILPVPIAAVTAAATPPFVVSPYGVVIDPAPVGVFPDGTAGPGGNVQPCNNPY